MWKNHKLTNYKSKNANLVNRSLTVLNRLKKFAKLKKFELIILEIPVFCIQA